MGLSHSVFKLAETTRLGRAERDLVTLGIAIAAIMLFVATGGQVLPDVVRALSGHGSGPDHLLANALVLNVALIIFGWRRYRELTLEIGERRKAEQTARRLAEIDPLTGCFNRRSMASVTNALRHDALSAGQSLAFVMVDLDNFKQINDMHGHSTGDKVLNRIADALRETLPEDAVLARLGGDEFAFVLPYKPDDEEAIDQQIGEIFKLFATPLLIDMVRIDITMSIGIVSESPTVGPDLDTKDAETLMHRADIAMYRAKKQGKNRFVWFEPNMENELRFRNELEAGIRRGLNHAEFVPYYEQQIDLETGRLVGFEMLARWNSPHLGLVKPETFIPIAEEIGVITELSEQLMVQAFADASEWDPELTISVNISPLQLRDPWFAQKLLRLIVENNFPAHRLEIEITENCLHEDIGAVRTIMTSLKNQGVRVGLDDFGTGYSSLATLKTLPFDRLKIDRSFIAELGTDDVTSTIVDAIVTLGKGLQMPITAEGIENKDILDVLRRMGRIKGQGYFYGRPESAEQVKKRLQMLGLLAANDVRHAAPALPDGGSHPPRAAEA